MMPFQRYQSKHVKDLKDWNLDSVSKKIMWARTSTTRCPLSRLMKLVHGVLKLNKVRPSILKAKASRPRQSPEVLELCGAFLTNPCSATRVPMERAIQQDIIARKEKQRQIGEEKLQTPS